MYVGTTFKDLADVTHRWNEVSSTHWVSLCYFWSPIYLLLNDHESSLLMVTGMCSSLGVSFQNVIPILAFFLIWLPEFWSFTCQYLMYIYAYGDWYITRSLDDIRCMYFMQARHIPCIPNPEWQEFCSWFTLYRFLFLANSWMKYKLL